MRAVLAVAVAVTVSACATPGPTWEQFNSGLERLRGRGIGAATAKLGPADDVQTRDNHRLYKWTESAQQVLYMPSYNTVRGTLGAGFDAPAINATISGGQYVPVTVSCALTLEADESHVITRYTYKGNLSGCAPFIEALQDDPRAAQ